jgi:hypothetical protein
MSVQSGERGKSAAGEGNISYQVEGLFVEGQAAKCVIGPG